MDFDLRTRVKSVKWRITFNSWLAYRYLDNLTREIARMLYAVIDSVMSPGLTGCGTLGSKVECESTDVAHVSSCCICSYI